MLDEEWEEFQQKISQKESKSLRDKIYSDFSFAEVPFEVQEELTRQSLNIGYSDWKKLSNQERGKLMAIQSIKNKQDILDRFYNELRSASKQAKK